MSELFDGQGDGEEVESVPTPAEKGDEEEHPLLQIEKGEQLDRIGRFAHRWLEGWNASGDVGADGHLLRRLMVIARRRVADLLLIVVGSHVVDGGSQFPARSRMK